MCQRRGLLYILIPFTFAALALTAVACHPKGRLKEVTIVADGQHRSVETRSATVRALLEEAGLSVGPLDRVEPDLWRDLADGDTVTITRVEVREEVEELPIAFEQKTVKSEAMRAGEQKLLQLGSAGREEIVYRTVLEDGEVTERVEVLRRVVEPPVDEIIAVGLESRLPSLAIRGTVVYVSGGNAWVMRGTTGGRRPLTSSGDLDGRVLALSHDGDWLVYSRVEHGASPDTLNSLWIVGTDIVNEEPHPLGIGGAIYAEWMGDTTVEGRSLVYSTAERIQGAPGWKAHNDLWRADVTGLKPAGERTGSEEIEVSTELVAPPPAEELYGWWGTNFALSPDGRHVAYGRPASVGIVDLSTGEETALIDFAVYHTYGEWVWLPELSWSPDGTFIVCSVHGRSFGGSSPEDSAIFDIWVLDREGKIRVPLVSEAGMWSAPSWSPMRDTEDGGGESTIAYGQARLPRDSQNSRYDLYVMDRDGSNRRKVFPPPDREGLVAPDLAWSPDGDRLIAAHEGNLFLIDPLSGKWDQITADGQSGQPRWAGRPASRP